MEPAAVALAAASACITGTPRTPRNDIAIIEAGEARIARIDGYPIHAGNNGAFEVRPGGHTVEISEIWLRAKTGSFRST